MQKFLQELFRTLQYFADGAPAGDGDGAPSGDGGNADAADAGQQKDPLEALGVPQREIAKFRAIKAKGGNETVPGTEPTQDAAAAMNRETGPENRSEPEPKPAGQTLTEALDKNPEWKNEYQRMFSQRIRKSAEEKARLENQNGQMMNILRMVARDQGMKVDDGAELNLEELMNRMENDESRYADMAEELDVDPKVAMQLDRQKRENEQLKAEKKRAEAQTVINRHIESLKAEAEELKSFFPDFDLRNELDNNKEFRDAMNPFDKNGNPRTDKRPTIKEFFLGKRGEEFAKKRVSQAVTGTRQAAANALRAGQTMPGENGTVQRAASPVKPVLYSKASKEQKAQIEREIRSGRWYK